MGVLFKLRAPPPPPPPPLPPLGVTMGPGTDTTGPTIGDKVVELRRLLEGDLYGANPAPLPLPPPDRCNTVGVLERFTAVGVGDEYKLAPALTGRGPVPDVAGIVDVRMMDGRPTTGVVGGGAKS